MKYYHFHWMKRCSFWTGGRSMCIWVFLTNLTKKHSFVKKVLIFLDIFLPLVNSNIYFSNFKRGSCRHLKKKNYEPKRTSYHTLFRLYETTLNMHLILSWMDASHWNFFLSQKHNTVYIRQAKKSSTKRFSSKILWRLFKIWHKNMPNKEISEKYTKE